MTGNVAQKIGRTLAEIESDLVEAEAAFADADERFKKARHDRRAALSTIDKHQDELDECLLYMRQRSVPGTKWCLELGKADETLELHSEDIVADGTRNSSTESCLTSEATEKATSKDFDSLRAATKAQGDDPVLKVVSSPRG